MRFSEIVKTLKLHNLEFATITDNFTKTDEIFVQTVNPCVSRVLSFTLDGEFIKCYNVNGNSVICNVKEFSILGLLTGQFTNINYYSGWRKAAESPENRMWCNGESPKLEEKANWEDIPYVNLPWEGDAGYEEYQNYLDKMYEEAGL